MAKDRRSIPVPQLAKVIFVIPKLAPEIFYLYAKYGDTVDPDHAPFKGDLSSVCRDLT